MFGAVLLNSALALSPVLVFLVGRSRGADEAALRLAYLFFGLPVVSAFANQLLLKMASRTGPYLRSSLGSFKLGLVIGPMVGYGVWGISTGLLLTPDRETIALLLTNVLFSYLFGNFVFSLISQRRDA